MNRSTLRTRTRALFVGAGVTCLTLLAACGDDGGDPADPAAPAAEGEACAPEDVTLIGQVRNETNPYEASWLDGGDAFAESVGLTQQRLTYDGESARQQEQVRQVLSGEDLSCTVLNVLPNGDADTTPIVRQADTAGAFLITQWNKPADLAVTDYDRWVAHITYDGRESGRLIAEAMIEEMGGEGGIIALQGILDTAAAQERYAGLEEALAEAPGVTLLDEQTANFSRAEALEVTRTLLTRHGEDIKGVWAANDDMALGALQALEAAGRTDVAVVGIDAVPDAIAAIEDGTMTATVSSDGPWQGGVGLAMGYCAATGELDVSEIPEDQRAFYATQFLVTEENVADFTESQVDESAFECANVFDRVEEPLP